MSEQAVKVVSTDKEKVIQEIMNLAFLVNQRTERCVFIRFSGHVDGLEIDVRKSKENYNTEYCDTESYTTDSIEELKFIRANLIKLLRDGKLDLNELPYTVEEIRHYHL